ncbi:hypothetical protein CN227_18660 [Sinorhizobium meliloti]|uniref:hypothetical protein n=1 Tax=Rhizobium meliloti TaxID=382 RepID=UPI000FDA5097|nr:hypothetical protein [Sinorhizobium meliloti]RVE80119.1 hypothetical protein CN240_19335 [Sinorhizobium meliloti]RVG44217.1 hypothetical protein CN227_18660 [Sinorhizobium meliloti]
MTLVGTHAHLIIADEVPDFVPSPEILTLLTNAKFRLVRHPRHEDYSVWEGGRIVAQGGRELMERVFKERTE